MEKFLGTKLVQAERMNEYEATQKGLYNRHKEGDEWREGFKVVYEDGYESWSPLDVFEKSYKPCDNFVDRMKIEIKDLQEKQCKLRTFIESAKFNELPMNKSLLLEAQYGAMLAYSNILTERIRLEETKDAE